MLNLSIRFHTGSSTCYNLNKLDVEWGNAMLSILVHAQSVRWLFPAAAMLTAAPIHITAWTAVRLLTLPLPRRFYRALDDSLYSTYQRYVLFFMRCYTGAEVINFSRKGGTSFYKRFKCHDFFS